MKSKEIEIKVRVEKTSDLISFLQKEGVFLGQEHQVDEYFTPKHRDFTEVRPVEEWLRVRKSDGKYTITYKKWHTETDRKSHFCDEYETEISDIDQFKKILESLDFKHLATVDKNRKTWVYNDFKISIDTVLGLGEYIEIEYNGNDKDIDPKAITEKMLEFLKMKNCGTMKRNYQGYPFLIMFPEEFKEEEII